MKSLLWLIFACVLAGPLRGEDRLSLAAKASKEHFAVGEQVTLILTYTNLTSQPLTLHNPASPGFCQFTFTDAQGQPIAFTETRPPAEESISVIVAPGERLERTIALNHCQLAGLGHPYTAIGQEPRTFLTQLIYRTPAGLDGKNPALWYGEVQAAPVTINIVPDTAAARSQGEARASADIAAGRAVIFHYGKPWSQGKPLIDDATGLPVEIAGGCTVGSLFAAEIDAYNETIRAWQARRSVTTDPAKLLVQLSQTTDPTEKWQLIRQLGELSYEPASEAFAAALRDPHALVRANAARALSLLRTPRPLPVIAALEREKEAGAIEQMSLALRHWRAWPALPALRRAASHPREQTRMWVIQAIGQLGDEGDLAFLARYLGDPSSSVASSAAEAIQRLAHEDFGYPLPAGPVDAAQPLAKARAWWQEHRAAYEARDNEAPIDCLVGLSHEAAEEVRAGFVSGRGQHLIRHDRDDASFLESKLTPHQSHTLSYGREQSYITRAIPGEGLAEPALSPDEFEQETLGISLTITAYRRQGRIHYSGQCSLPRLESETTNQGATPMISSATLTRQARFTGSAAEGQPIAIPLGATDDTLQLILTLGASAR